MEPEKNTKKSIFSKLSNLVFEGEPEVETSKETASSIQENAGSQVSTGKFSYSDAQQTSNIPVNFIQQNSNGVFDEKFYNNFLQVIEKNNIDGMDYFEFSKAKKALDSSGLAENVKYQAAFSSLKANSNLTKQRLLETADFYIDKLGEEEVGFNTEMQSEIESQVNSRLAQAQSKQDEISKKQEKINSLQSEMGILQGEISTLNMEAQQTQAKIDSTAKNFKVSLEVIKGQINLDKQNITSFLQ